MKTFFRTLAIGVAGLALTCSGFSQERIRDVIYLKQGGCAYTMDVFKPKTPNHAGVIFMVSGGWFSSHDMISTDVAKAFTDAGFTVFEVVHGSQPKYTLPEIVPQIRRAVRFIHANAATYGVDPTRLGISGGSAGGHLSLMIAGTEDNGKPDAKDPVDQQPSSVKAVVAFFPPTDFLNWGEKGKSSFHIPQLGIFMPAFGVNPATPEDKIERLDRDLAPIHYVTSKFPPTLLIHGDADKLVPYQQSQIFLAELKKNGVESDLVTIPGGDHGGRSFTEGIPAAVQWFLKHL